MATQIQWRKGTTAQHATFTGAIGEVTVDTDKDVIVVHDGVTAGGFPSATEASVTNHISDATAAHAASAISNTPTGSIAATTVQAAIDELESEKAALAGSASQAFSTAALTTVGLFDISGASAGQIKFPATQNASADANTLDDYEEGTFSPTVYGTTAGGTGTYTTQSGRYIKVGKLVFASVGLTWTAHTGTGNMGIGNLPFTCFNTSTVAYQSMNAQCANLTVPAGAFVAGQVTPGATTMLLYSVAAAGNVWTALALDTAATIFIEFMYEATA